MNREVCEHMNPIGQQCDKCEIAATDRQVEILTDELHKASAEKAKDDALLKKALEWIEAQPEPRMIGAAKIITSIKERLG